MTKSGRTMCWREQLPTSGHKVGLVWKGRPDFRRDRYRSLSSITELRPLWDVPGVSFVKRAFMYGSTEAR